MIGIIGGLIVLFFQSTIKEIIAKFGADKSKKDINLIFTLLLIAAFGTFFLLSDQIFFAMMTSEEKEEPKIDRPKTDTEVALEAGKFITERVEEGVKKREQRTAPELQPENRPGCIKLDHL